MARGLGRKIGFMLLWPGLFLYFAGSRRTRIMLVSGGEILLVRDSSRYFFDSESWTLPGGGIKRGEEVSVAAARELFEELGISVEPDALVLLGNQPSGGHGLNYQAYFLLYQADAKPIATAISHEISAVRWISLEEATKLPLKLEARQGLALLAAQQ